MAHIRFPGTSLYYTVCYALITHFLGFLGEMSTGEAGDPREIGNTSTHMSILPCRKKIKNINYVRKMMPGICMKNGYVVSDADDMKEIWRMYIERLLNVESERDGEVACHEVMGPCCLIGYVAATI